MKAEPHVIVGNRGSYYHEGYWAGKKNKFSQDFRKAKLFKGKVPSKRDLEEYDYVRENFSHAYPMFVRLSELG